MVLLDGKKVANEIIEKVKEKIINNNLNIGIAIIWIGNNNASEIYINNKLKKCEYVGITPYVFHLDENIKELEVEKLITSLNERKDIQGIILHSPVPNHIDFNKCANLIYYKKDIDGVSNISMGNMLLGTKTHISCTAKGIIKLLDYYNIDLKGKKVCLINRSNVVGKPLFHLLIEKDATVTMCHSKTSNLSEFTKNADIIISAVGKENIITSDMVKENVIIIDVGISNVNGKVKGDVDFDNVSKKASYITQVPGGIGSMTIAMALENILEEV